jgi:cytochrome c-type biogenesis protein CcsB
VVLAQLSQQLLGVTVIAYTAALAAHATEYATARHTSAQPAEVRDLALVGAGTLAPPSPPERKDLTTEHRSPWPGRLAVAATALGAAAQAGCLALRGVAAQRVPWGNMYEFVLLACLVGVVAWLVVSARRPMRLLGAFVMLAVVALLAITATELYVPAGPLAPALDSYWLKIHVVAAASSTGLLLLGFLAAVLSLVARDHRTRVEAGRELRFPATLGPRLPGADRLDALSFRIHAIVFPLWTFAIITGAIWAESAWGAYWSWDPKETWALISWLCYAAYLHARATPGTPRRLAPWIAVVGWATMVANLFVVNLFVSGLHSYAGI